jgi:uncharacterized protein YbaR (Trm112 family)
MIDDAVLSVLRCPVSRQKLRRASDDEKRAHAAPLDDEALISEDGKYFYRSQNGIPVLLPPQDLVTVDG